MAHTAGTSGEMPYYVQHVMMWFIFLTAYVCLMRHAYNALQRKLANDAGCMQCISRYKMLASCPVLLLEQQWSKCLVNRDYDTPAPWYTLLHI